MFKKRLCELALTTAITSSILCSGCTTPTRTSFESYQHIKNQQTIDTAILVAAPSDMYEWLRIPFEPLYEAVVVSALKDKLNIKGYTITFNATWKNLTDVLEDPSIQNIVVAGHGSWNHWCATDQTITDDMLSDHLTQHYLPKKHGLFIRHTCGKDRYSYDKTENPAFGSSAVDEASKTRGYNGLSSPFDYLFNPIPD